MSEFLAGKVKATGDLLLLRMVKQALALMAADKSRTLNDVLDNELRKDWDRVVNMVVGLTAMDVEEKRELTKEAVQSQPYKREVTEKPASITDAIVQVVMEHQEQMEERLRKAWDRDVEDLRDYYFGRGKRRYVI